MRGSDPIANAESVFTKTDFVSSIQSEGNGNYFADNRAGCGADISSYFHPELPTNTRYNTFEGYHLSTFYVAPTEAFDMEFCDSQLNPILQDVYVTPDGSDSDSGLSWGNAFQTVHHAMSQVYGTAENPVSVFIGPGSYSPTGTVTPECQALGVEIWMPDNYFTKGELCACSVFVCNPDSEIYESVPLFVILDVYGQFFFAPSFSEFDYYVIELPPGRLEIVVIPEFQWPVITDFANGIIWYSAMTDPVITKLFGAMDQFEFGWGN